MTDKNTDQKASVDESMALAQKLQEEEDAQMLKEAAEEPKEPQGQPISSYVKQDLVKQIMEMGFG